MRSRRSSCRHPHNTDPWEEGAPLFGRRSANQLTRRKAAKPLNLLVNRGQKLLQNGFEFIA